LDCIGLDCSTDRECR